MDTPDRVVTFVGPSGGGKSCTINQIMKRPAAKTREEEMHSEKGLCVSSSLWSCSEVVISKGPCRVEYRKADGSGQSFMNVVLTDSPGVPDTGGRAARFLDDIIKHLKDSPSNGMVLVLDANVRFNADLLYCLMALKECFNGQLRESRLIIYVNKLPVDFALEQQGLVDQEEKNDFRKEKAQEIVKYVVGHLLGQSEVQSFQNFVCNMEGTSDGKEPLKTAISQLPSVPMNPEQFRTWTEQREWYRKLLFEAMSKEEMQKDLIERKQNEVLGLESDIRWHKKCLEDYWVAQGVLRGLSGVATAASATTFRLSAEIAAAVGSAFAGVVEVKIRHHTEAVETKEKEVCTKKVELQDLQKDLKGQIEKELAQCRKLAKEFEDLEKQITQTLSTPAY